MKSIANVRFFRALIVGLSAAVLAACGTTSARVTHVDQHAEHFGVNVISVVSQNDVAAADDEHAHSLVAQAVAKFEFNSKRNKTQPPHLVLRDALAVVDVRNELAKNLSTDLAKGAPFTVSSVEPRNALPAKLEDQLRTLTDSGLLVLDTVYYLTPNLRALRVESHVTMYSPSPVVTTKSGKEKKPGKPIVAYKNVLVVHQEVLPTYADKALEFWMQDDGRHAIEALRFALREVARLLIWDINDQQQPTKKSGRASSFKIASSERSGSSELKGTLVMETVSRYLVRTSDGALYSLPNPNFREPTPDQ